MPSQFEATAGLAIGTTSGGTVTQATNKATGVTLNTESGQITMNAASLGDGAYVTFAVTNDRVSATDVVNVGHGSGGTAGGYVVVNSAVAAGSFKVTVGNVSGGSLSQAIVVNFAVQKGAAS